MEDVIRSAAGGKRKLQNPFYRMREGKGAGLMSRTCPSSTWVVSREEEKKKEMFVLQLTGMH